MGAHILHKEGKHYTHDELEFWAEEGIVVIMDYRDGSCSFATCAEWDERASAMIKEATSIKYASDALNIRQWLAKMDAVWQEAKQQGDPADPEVAKRKARERRKATMVRGMW